MAPYPEPGYTSVFDLIFSELSASDATEPEALMLNATHLKAHPTASSLNKGCEPPAGSITPGGMTDQLHGVCDSIPPRHSHRKAVHYSKRLYRRVSRN